MSKMIDGESLKSTLQTCIDMIEKQQREHFNRERATRIGCYEAVIRVIDDLMSKE